MDETMWIIDKVHSSVEFSIRHMMISTVRGRFTDYDAEITGNPDDLKTMKARFVIKVASIDTGEPDRDKHLRSDEILAMTKFPTITFVTRNISGNQDDLNISGDLTIKGITKQVTFKGEYGGKLKDPYGNIRFGLTASASINRSDFEVKWNMVLEGGGLMLGDKVNLHLQLEAFAPAQKIKEDVAQ